MKPPNAAPGKKRRKRRRRAQLTSETLPVRRAGYKRNKDGPGYKFIPTDAQRRKVEALVACDFTNLEISVAMKLPLATLTDHFREELNSGRTQIFAELASGMVEQARLGDKTMQIYLSKARMGWRERTSVGFEDKTGAATDGLFTISITGGPKTEIKTGE